MTTVLVQQLELKNMFFFFLTLQVIPKSAIKNLGVFKAKIYDFPILRQCFLFIEKIIITLSNEAMKLSRLRDHLNIRIRKTKF